MANLKIKQYKGLLAAILIITGGYFGFDPDPEILVIAVVASLGVLRGDQAVGHMNGELDKRIRKAVHRALNEREK